MSATGHVPLDYDGRRFLIPAQFSDDVEQANRLAGRLAAIEYCCEERQREVNPATRLDWYEGYAGMRLEYLRLCGWLIPHALPLPAVPGPARQDRPS